jgi:hypothetical protein
MPVEYGQTSDTPLAKAALFHSLISDGYGRFDFGTKDALLRCL